MSKISAFSALRLSKLDPKGTVFSEYTALANLHKSTNLGQGFPTLPVADFILLAADKAIKNNPMGHQYTRSEGHPRLVKALAKFYSPKLNRELDPMNEIMTTVGASEAIYSTIQALINPGDEVILMQPYYDSYPASVLLAGGTSIIVSLKSKGPRSSDWTLDMNTLESKITPKSKLIILNNPNNPLGKVWTREELLEISRIAKKYNLLVLADEVYETLVYTDSVAPMIKFASLPDMFDRTITVGSMGKAFGVTGWKIGWVLASKELVRSCWLVHQFLPFSVVTPLQEAGADALEQACENGYFEETVGIYQKLRDQLYEALDKNGFKPCKPDGGYFIVSDIQKFGVKEDFSTYLTKEVGVTSIPMRAFYDRESHQDVEHLVRFAFCKDKSTLDKGIERLQRIKSAQ